MEIYSEISQEIVGVKQYISEVGRDYVNNSALYIIEAMLTVSSVLPRNCSLCYHLN